MPTTSTAPTRRPTRRVLGLGSWVLGLGSWVLGLGSWVLGLGSWIDRSAVRPWAATTLMIPVPGTKTGAGTSTSTCGRETTGQRRPALRHIFHAPSNRQSRVGVCRGKPAAHHRIPFIDSALVHDVNPVASHGNATPAGFSRVQISAGCLRPGDAGRADSGPEPVRQRRAGAASSSPTIGHGVCSSNPGGR
jgi:hypothetical protein